MSIRSRIATFEARNQELRKETVPVARAKGLLEEDEQQRHHPSHNNNNMTRTNDVDDDSVPLGEPRIVTPSSVAGRFGSTSLQQPLHLRASAATAMSNNSGKKERTKAPPPDQLEDQHLHDNHIEEPPRVQRYQPLHQQYQQRQAQSRLQHRQHHHHQRHRQQQNDDSPPRTLSPPHGAEEEEPSMMDNNTRSDTPTGNNNRNNNRSGGGTPQLQRRAIQQQRRLEQMRRLEDSQRRLHEQQQHKMNQRGDRYLPEPKRKDDGYGGGAHAQQQQEMEAGKFSKASTASRLAKIQRMQRNRSMDKVRRNHQTTRLEDYEQRPPSPEAVPRDLSMQPSAADDEITLTSVRQIVGTATSHESSSPLSKKSSHVYPDEMTYTDDRDWPSEEKSAKDTRTNKTKTTSSGRNGIVMSVSSSSSDAVRNQTVPAIPSQLTSASFFVERRLAHPNSPVDGQTEGQGDDDDDDHDDNASQGSESFAQRKERERSEEKAREAAVQKAKADMEGPFLKAEDVDYYQKSINTPMAKTAAGLAVAASIGCVVLGPIGLLVGTAAVGIGVGVMQIPAEQRQKLEDKASRTLRQLSDTALTASESLSDSCANSYQKSGLADHVPGEVNNCCAAIRETPTTDKSEISASAAHNTQDLGELADVHMDHTDRTMEELPKRLPPRRAGAACLRDGTSPSCLSHRNGEALSCVFSFCILFAFERLVYTREYDLYAEPWRPTTSLAGCPCECRNRTR
eukprot:scaffold6764_cov169-Amphora_coffeaeformis.AAC.8